VVVFGAFSAEGRWYEFHIILHVVYSIVPSSCRHTIPEELENISIWAEQNNLKLNVEKSKEIIIYRRTNFEFPTIINGITRVTSMRVLWVILCLETEKSLNTFQTY